MLDELLDDKGMIFYFFLQSLSSPLSPCKRHHVPPPRITLRDLVPEQILDKDPPTPPVSDTDVASPRPITCASPREKGEFKACAGQHLINIFVFFMSLKLENHSTRQAVTLPV